jgi:hypothetical protein
VMRELIQQAEALLSARKNRTAGGGAAAAKIDQFALIGSSFPLTLIAKEQETEAQRKELAQLLFQPLDRPLFLSPQCALSTEHLKHLALGGILLNVHEGIPPSGVPNGKKSLVQGPYAYYHYLQQDVNDKVSLLDCLTTSSDPINRLLHHRDGDVRIVRFRHLLRGCI